MASGTRTRPAVIEPDIHEDHPHHLNHHKNNHVDIERRPLEERTNAQTQAQAQAQATILGEIHQNIIAKPALDVLAVELSNFHIAGSPSSPSKENLVKTRGRKARAQVEFTTFQLPAEPHRHELHLSDDVRKSSGTDASVVSHGTEDSSVNGPLEAATRELPSNAEQLLKHHAGQFDWVLSIPAATSDGPDSATSGGPPDATSHEEDVSPPGGERRLFFGCNFVHRKTPLGDAHCNNHGKPADVVTVLATRIDGEEESCSSTEKAAITDEASVTSTTHADSTILRMDSPEVEKASSRRTSEVALGSKSDIVDQIISLPPANPASRIEDSVEALDKLEEELEALNEVARLDRVLSPDESKGGPVVQNINISLKRTGSVAKKAAAGTVRVRSTADRSSSSRKSVSASQDEGNAGAASSKAPRKSVVTRPASLLPPKPPAKSSKPPTISTFELPGDAVSRRLKEQREARLSRQIPPEEAALTAAAFSPSKPHAKSTKPPTRPTFELPGEAISRRKREEHEAKLRAQKEEERKRREFKARPIRASIVPSSFPRETIASRARQGKAAASQSEAEGSVAGTATPGDAARKRRSMAVGASAATPRSALSTRGRSELAVDSVAGTSRATSTSTGSIHGGGVGASSVISVSKRSTVSAEDQVQQKVRGREIFSRDNGIAAERERERRDREAAAKAARQDAAERSRQLSREWAEKQKAKRMSLMGSA